VFDQLRKNVSKALKTITVTDFSQKSISKVTNELRDILIKNEVAVNTAEAICDNLAAKLAQTEHTRFTNTRSIVLDSLK